MAFLNNLLGAKWLPPLLVLLIVSLGSYTVGVKVEKGRNDSVKVIDLTTALTEFSVELVKYSETNAAIQDDTAAVIKENADAERVLQDSIADISDAFDSLRKQAERNAHEVEEASVRGSCTVERAEARRLHGELQSTLGELQRTLAYYNREAARADVNTRDLNLCIRTLNNINKG